MILDAEGRDIEQVREQWRVGALYSWLSDAKIQRVCVQQRIFTPQQLRAIGVKLGRCLQQNGDRNPEDYVYLLDVMELRSVMLRLLRNRITRHIIARIAYAAEVENYRAEKADYDEAMDRWMAEIDRWIETESGERPLRPKTPPKPRHRRDVVKELQEERERLDAWHSEATKPSSIIAP